MEAKNKYWQDRFNMLQESQLSKGQKYYYELEQQYKRASMSIEKDVAVWYSRFAKNNKISFVEAKKMLMGDYLKEFKWNVADYIKYGEENALNQHWMKELENVSAKFYISRLEALKIQMQHQIEVVFGNQIDGIDKLARDMYSNGYYHTAYEIQKGFNIGYGIAALNATQLSQVISKPWSADNLTFTDRCWTSKQQLISALHTGLTQSIIRGDAPEKLIKSISSQFNVSKNKAGRLVMTESAFFASSSQRDCFNELDVERFEIVATLDLSTSEICQGLDGQIFLMKDYNIGVTAPPFHCWCRTVTVPYFNDNFGERAAKGADGKTYYVPSNMNYKDWYNKYVKGNPGEELAGKKLKNAYSDKQQYEKYKTILGNDVPKSFDKFQDLKYNNVNEWNKLKGDYKKINYYNKVVVNETQITNDLINVSKSTNTELVGLEYRLKSKDSYLRKVNSDSKNSLEPLIIKDTIESTNDIIRYTYQNKGEILVDSYNNINKSLSDMGYSQVKVKNFWNNKNSAYKGVNCIYQSPNGQNFEVQFHTPQSFELKNGELHKLYEEMRLDTTSFDRKNELNSTMFKLSSKLQVPKGIESIK